LKGVAVIAGADTWLAEEALERLLQEAVGPNRADAVQVLRGDETSWGRVLDAARMRSLFADRRAVVVRHADSLSGDGEDVAAYVDDPTPGVVLILMAAKPDKRRTAWKRIFDRAQVVAADPPKGRAIRGHVMDQLRRRNLALSEDAIAEVVERVGQDSRRLMGELDKLEAFAAGRQGRLSAEDVAASLGRGLAPPLYKLTDALTSRRAAESLHLLEELLVEGEPPLKILSALHRTIRQVRGAKALREARAPREEVASRLGVLPFKVGDLLDATRSWSEVDLQVALAALDQADRRVKTGTDGRVALTAAVAEACRGKAKVRPSGTPGR